jgi:hypothetical protein
MARINARCLLFMIVLLVCFLSPSLVLIRFVRAAKERADRDTRADRLAGDTWPRSRLATEENEPDRDFFPRMAKKSETSRGRGQIAS